MLRLLNRRLLTVMLVCLMTMLSVVPAMAESVTHDGLTVTISTDKEVYTAADTVNVSVKLHNSTTEPISNVTVAIVDGIPHGYIQGSSRNCSISKISGNSSATAAIELLPTEVPETGDSTPLWALLGICAAACAVLALNTRCRRSAMCLLMVLSVVATVLPLPVAAAEDAPYSGSFDVTKDVKIGDTVSTLKLRISYQYGDRMVTRGEWIEALVAKMGMHADALTEDQYYYRDSLDSTYGEAVEIAQLYGILPTPDDIEDPDQDIPYFNPDQPATREFAAYTAVLACGFTGEHYVDTSLWADLNSITYADHAVIAVAQGFMALDANHCFNADRTLSRREMNAILDGIDALIASTDIDADDLYDHTVYVEGVVRDELTSLETYTVTELSGGKYEVRMPVTAGTSLLEAGTVFVLPAIEEYYTGIALKVESIQQQGNEYVARCTEPELAEVVSKIDAVSFGIPMVDAVTVGDGVGMEYVPYTASASNDTLYTTKIEKSETKGLGQFKFTIPESGVKITDKLKGSIDITIKVPEVTTKVVMEVNWFDTEVTEFLYQIKDEIEISANVEYTLVESGTFSGSGSQKLSDRKELGRIPIALGATGLSLEIVFSYTYSAKGTLEISYTINGYQGYQYKNGAFRFINDLDDELDFLKIKGEAEARLEIGVELCFAKFWDIFGGYINAGVGFAASFTPRITTEGTLFCGDVRVAALSTIGVNEEDIVGKFLKDVCHFTIKKDLLKNDSKNPLSFGVHVENFTIVPECTFGGGEVVGTVKTAEGRTPVSNARVQIYKDDASFDTSSTGTPDTPVLRSMYTDSTGKYSIDNLDAGTYLIRVSATGYQTYWCQIEVMESVTAYAESLLLIDRDDLTQDGSVDGTIRDAVTGNQISGVSYTIYPSWNVQSGDAVKQGTFTSSSYSLDLPVGNYTLCYSKDGYTSNYINITITADETTQTNLNLVPEDDSETGDGILEYDQIRVVLTWGQYPSDLDSHMFGASGGTVYHTYYVDKNAYIGGDRFLNLDLDDTTSYGPETTTIYTVSACDNYSFYVHDYTNRRSTASSALSNSGARVQVYYGDTLVNNFYVPEGYYGTVWHVFDYDVASRELIPVNTFSYSSEPSNLGIATYGRRLQPLDESTMLRLIYNTTLEEK